MLINDDPRVLTPFNKREAISLSVAAQIAGKSETTVRTWCGIYHIGRRVVGGPWQVSRVALQMLLDGDDAALACYLSGDRSSPSVTRYFQMFGIPLPQNSQYQQMAQ